MFEYGHKSQGLLLLKTHFSPVMTYKVEDLCHVKKLSLVVVVGANLVALDRFRPWNEGASLW